MMPRRPATLFVAALLTWVAAGCSLPADHAPRAIERDRLPAILRPSQSPTTTVVGGDDVQVAQICFVNDGDVQCVERKVKRIAPDVLFGTLVDGPTEAERNDGSSSFIPPATNLSGSNLSDHVLTLNLSDAINDVGPPNNKTAFAQIVYTTIKSIPAVRKVSVTVDGKPTKIPTDTGPVAAAGLSDFATPAPTTTLRAPAKNSTAVPTPSLGD